MDRNKCRDIRADLEALLWAFADLEKKHGVKVSIGSANYGASETSFKFQFNEVSADGSVGSKEADAFKALASSYGLQPSDLGKTFDVRGQQFKIVGLKPRATKMPILAESRGRRYKFSENAVAVYLGRKPKPSLFASVSVPSAPDCEDDND